jgi:hypothetical protein
MQDPVQWLRAQLGEDERVAREAAPGPWRQDPERVDLLTSDEQGYVVDCSGAREARTNAEHIARHDPARVLREVDAKRQLLAIHRPYVAEPDQACLGCAGGIEFERCPVVRLLALPYAGRPGYREDWRP